MGGLIPGLRLLSFALLSAVLACHPSGPRARSLVVVDDAGDSVSVRVPAPPGMRIASIAGASAKP